MNYRWTTSPTVALTTALALALFACSPPDEAGVRRKGSAPKAQPTHGGQLMMLQGGNGYVEAKQDESKGNLTVWVMNSKMEPMPITDVPVVNFTESPDGAQSKGVAAGEGAQHTWVFTHDLLKAHVHGVRIRVVSGGQTYNLDWHAPH